MSPSHHLQECVKSTLVYLSIKKRKFSGSVWKIYDSEFLRKLIIPEGKDGILYIDLLQYDDFLSMFTDQAKKFRQINKNCYYLYLKKKIIFKVQFGKEFVWWPATADSTQLPCFISHEVLV